jgi:hypothetical protein
LLAVLLDRDENLGASESEKNRQQEYVGVQKAEQNRVISLKNRVLTPFLFVFSGSKLEKLFRAGGTGRRERKRLGPGMKLNRVLNRVKKDRRVKRVPRVFLIAGEAQKKNPTSFSIDAERVRGPR